MSGAVLVFAKDPAPHQVKTRLTPPFTPEQAAEFYACMLEDVLVATRDAASSLGLATFLAIHPEAAVVRWQARVPEGVQVVAQHGAGLSERMAHAFASLRAEGFDPVLVRGSDSPSLPPATLAQTLEALEHHDVVLGPDVDGGYNLVGARRAVGRLFDHPMSTGSVLDDTLANARELGLSTRLLDASYDIDVAEDLERLASDRERGQLDTLCPKTLDWLDRFQRWPRPADA